MATKATKKKATKNKGAKAQAPRVPRAHAEKDGSKRVSQIDAAVRVLKEAREPMNCLAIVEAMGAKGYWTSPGGKTPHATLYSAILREITTKGKASRFVKTERGKFGLKS